jgi:hypothetical protein
MFSYSALMLVTWLETSIATRSWPAWMAWPCRAAWILFISDLSVKRNRPGGAAESLESVVALAITGLFVERVSVSVMPVLLMTWVIKRLTACVSSRPSAPLAITSVMKSKDEGPLLPFFLVAARDVAVADGEAIGRPHFGRLPLELQRGSVNVKTEVVI